MSLPKDRVTVAMDPEIIKQLDIFAAAHDRSRSWVITQAAKDLLRFRAEGPLPLPTFGAPQPPLPLNSVDPSAPIINPGAQVETK